LVRACRRSAWSPPDRAGDAGLKRIRLVVNPAARGDAAAGAATAFELARAEAGWEVELMRTEVRGHGVLLAEEAAGAGAELVAAVGGDGTAREVAAGLYGSATPMLIVPAGTGNSSYRELFGLVPWQEVMASALAGGAARSVDLNRIQPLGELSLLGFSIGWFAQIVELAAADTSNTGPARYATAAMATASAPGRFEAHVELDGDRLAGGSLGLVAVGGARVRGGVFPVLPASSLEDGLLEVLCVDAVDSDGFSEVMDLVLRGADAGDPRVHRGRGRSLLVRSGAVLPAEVDGDLWDKHSGETRVEVAPGSLRVVRAPGSDVPHV
jgi:diacylglycerol kinase (ATP)